MEEKRISLTAFPGTVREQLTRAGAWCRQNPGGTLHIPAGVYLLQDKRAKEIMDDVFEGKYGPNPQPTMFNPNFAYTSGLDLTGCRDITVEAIGALLLIDGFMEPVTIRDAQNVTVRGLTIDHKRKPFSRGTVVAYNPETKETDIKIDPCTPFDGAKASYPRNFFVNSKTHLIEEEMLGSHHFRGEIAPGVFRYDDIDGFDGIVGSEVYFTHTFHFRPAILISHSENTRLEDVTILSMCGMGIVGFKSRDIAMNRIHIIPDVGYAMSTNTDATHFACCRGTVSVENSTFAGHGDDAINIHNYYYRICDADGCNCTAYVHAVDGTHAQEPDFPVEGFELRLVNRHTLAPVDVYRVVASSEEERCRITLDHAVPEDTQNYLFANITELPRLIFRGNVVQRHLARSVLCKTHHSVIENNLFIGCTGTAVHIAAEASWDEGIEADDVTVRGNTFIETGCTTYGRTNGACAVSVNIAAHDRSAVGVNKNILIEDNTVVMSKTGECAFNVQNTEHAILRRNHVSGGNAPYLYVSASRDVLCDAESCGGAVAGEDTGYSIQK